MDDVQDSEEFKFFYSFFVENRELRDFYEKNQYSGEFCCLVCCGNDRFEGCFGIVQHSLKMIRLNKLQWVHKVLSFVICKVLGWEFTRLPTVVVNSVPLSQSLANLGKTLKSLNDDGKNAIEVIGNRVPGVEAAKEGGTEFEGSKSSEASYVPWPDPKPDDECPLTSWLPKPNAQESLVTCKLSAEELARFSMVQLQQRCVEKCKCFLPAVSGFESDGDEENDDSDDDLINEDVLEECEEFKHFLQLFTESRELREYYENHNEDGEFCCMICGAIDKKVWRTFKGCSGLLQHAVGISKTKKKKAHRVFGLAICKVLGWDFSRIPSVVLKREPLSTLLSKSGMLQTCVEEVDSSTENDVII